jgi:hypothetical protein
VLCHARNYGIIPLLRLASLALSLPDGRIRIRLTTVVPCVARIPDLRCANALLEVTCLVQLAGRGVDVTALGERDVAVVTGARCARANCDCGTGELVDCGLIDTGLACCT